MITRLFLIVLSALTVSLPACAQLTSKSIRASAKPIIFESERGSTYFLIDAHALSTGDPVATVLIGNTYGSRTVMDIALKCDARSYTYLAMDHNPNLPSTTEDIQKLHQQSRNMESSNLRGLTWTPISDDSYDAPFVWLHSKMCEPTDVTQ